MPKNALSVTLDQDNLLWLRARTTAVGGKSLSETLDRIITAARQSGRVSDDAIRSVAGTIDISNEDPDLQTADTYVRALFETTRTRRRAGAHGKGRRPGARQRGATGRRPKRG